MIFLHRQNKNVNSKALGIEIDVRSGQTGIMVCHEVANIAQTHWDLKYFVNQFKNKKVIVNIKESGIEEEVIEILNKHKVDYYFLDSQIPDIIRLAKKYPNISSKFIIRISNYESINNSLLEFIKPDYVWIDWFKFDNFNIEEYKKYYYDTIEAINNLGLSISPILVSPELYDLNYYTISEELSKEIFPENVCSKTLDLWKTYDKP